MTVLVTSRMSVRTAAKRELFRLLSEQPELAGVQVVYGWPKVLEDRHIIIGRTTGTQEIPTMKAGTPHRTDEFSIEIAVGAGKPGSTLEEAEDDLAPLLGEVEAVVAEAKQFLEIPEVNWCYVGLIEGPDLTWVSDTHPLSYATVTVEFSARYTHGATP